MVWVNIVGIRFITITDFLQSFLRPTKRERILEKRRRHKELFNRLYEAAQRGSGTSADEPATAFYDKMVSKTDAQQQLNREIHDRLPPDVRETVEGVPPGSYVRLQIVGRFSFLFVFRRLRSFYLVF